MISRENNDGHKYTDLELIVLLSCSRAPRPGFEDEHNFSFGQQRLSPHRTALLNGAPVMRHLFVPPRFSFLHRR